MYAIVYTDNGPCGPCGQSGLTTSPHCSVFLFRTEDEMENWLKNHKERMDDRRKSRRDARFRRCYPIGHELCNDLGSIVERIT